MASQRPDSPLENKLADTEESSNDIEFSEESSKDIDISEENSSEEKIVFWCDECGQKYRIPKDSAGKTGICFRCQAYLFIPSKSQEKPVPTKMIVFACTHCGSKQRKPRKLIGMEAECFNCGEKNIVPKKSKTSSLPKGGETQEDRILFWCSYCGQKYRLPKHLAGKSGNCDRCNNDFTIPAESQAKPVLKKTIVFPCKHCSQKLWKAEEQIGEEVKCEKCNGTNIVPEESKVSQVTKPEAEDKARIFFWCCHCGQKYRLPRSMGGKTAVCDRCSNEFIIPTESQAKPTRRETIIFPCEHCGKKIQKTRDLIGTEVKCIECGRGNIVPEKSKKSLFDLIAPGPYEPAIAAEATRMNLKIPLRTPNAEDTRAPEQTPPEINIPEKKRDC
jgi:RNase P subunit RPR2